jgi:hypothetical protein
MLPRSARSVAPALWVLGILLGASAAYSLGLNTSSSYLEDPRTARGVLLDCPRAPLRESLRSLSRATGVPLSASAALAEEPMTGYVPKRPLRETMGALEELFDGVWTRLPGSPPAYRLDPEPVMAKAQEAARRALLKRYQKAVDDLALQTMRQVKAARAETLDNPSRTLALSAILWSQLSPAQKERVLQGEPVTTSVPEAQAGLAYDLTLAITRNYVPAVAENKKLTGAMLATFDLELASTAVTVNAPLPSIRARASGMRDNSIIAAVSLIDVSNIQLLPRPAPRPETADDSPPLPAGIGQNGQLSGNRDLLVRKIGEACGVPILSRHQPDGTNRSVDAGGRKVSQVMADLAQRCGAAVEVNARGFRLLRSLTELLDASGRPPAATIQAYLKERPPAGKAVPFRTLSRLGELTPLQFSVLQRSSICASEAGFARQAFALLRFYRSLTPPQREELFSEKGLPVSTLAHAQLHALLDQRDKRANFDIYTHLQEINGLIFRFQESQEGEATLLRLQALRDGNFLAKTEIPLPVVEPEETPVASTQ